MKYLCKLHWFWTGRIAASFYETEEFYVDDKGEIPERVKDLLVVIARRYAFDCGDVRYPLHPHLAGLEVIPYAESERLDTSCFDQFLEREVAWTEQLIRQDKLFVNSQYNLTPADPAQGRT